MVLISQCYYPIQITVKYRKSLLYKKVQRAMLESMEGFRERYAIEIQRVGFDQNHVHILCRFLPKYSGGQFIRLIKSITSGNIFKEAPEVKKALQKALRLDPRDPMATDNPASLKMK